MNCEGSDTRLPLGKARRWIAALERGIGDLDPAAAHAIMSRAAESCSQNLWLRCTQALGHEPASAHDLVQAWNEVRCEFGMDAHGLWTLDEHGARAEFSQCGCPLVRASVVQLQPQHCLCSQAMVEVIFSRALGRPVHAVLGSAIGRGDETCRFQVTWQPQQDGH